MSYPNTNYDNRKNTTNVNTSATCSSIQSHKLEYNHSDSPRFAFKKSSPKLNDNLVTMTDEPKTKNRSNDSLSPLVQSIVLDDYRESVPSERNVNGNKVGSVKNSKQRMPPILETKKSALWKQVRSGDAQPGNNTSDSSTTKPIQLTTDQTSMWIEMGESTNNSNFRGGGRRRLVVSRIGTGGYTSSSFSSSSFDSNRSNFLLEDDQYLFDDEEYYTSDDDDSSDDENSSFDKY